ncbi:hypothetical protein HCN44_001715 [Aphidius gifuensis]|uniref:Venom protein n=1 Tax=Aphidius gifuensis TaxID=684658 RepID=A0A835CTJ0_APHGI|nr:mucin-5AC-like [Aphidius gifuensis]KAF7992390.1 hypothetical protein HCN44_001715 [Aphidius gifuensis]
MIFLLCFLTILNLGRCLDQVPTRFEIETSINRTIDEVERLIKTEPSLPRLSRSQIVDILHNITSTDMDSYEESIQKARTDYKKALMVVLPYNSKDSQGDDLNDLYTKPPMVQLIHDSEIMLPFASIQEEPIDRNSASEESIDNLISKKYPDDNNNQFKSSNNEYKNRQPAQSEYPEKFSFNLENFNSFKSKSSTVKPKVDIVYSTSVLDDSTTAKSINKIQTTRRSIDEGFRPTMPTTVSTNILSSDQWTYYAPPVTSKVTSTTPKIQTTRMTTTRRPVSSSSTVSAAAIITTTTTTTKSRRRPVTGNRHFITSSTTVSPTTSTSSTTTSQAPSTTTTTRRPRTSRTTVSSMTTTTAAPSTTTTTTTTTTRRPRTSSTTTVSPMTTTRQPTTTSTTTWQPPTTSSQPPASRKPSQIRNKPTYFLPTVISKTLDEEINSPFKKIPATRKPQVVKYDMSGIEFVEANPTHIPSLKNSNNNNFLPPFKKIPTPTTTSEPEAITFDMSNVAMIMEEEKPRRPVYVTPMATAPTIKDTPQPTATIPKIPQSMRKEVESLLATLGLRSSKDSNESKSSTLSNEINTEKDSIIQDSSNIIPGYTPSLDDAKNNSPSIAAQNTFNNIPNDLQNNVNNFTPDVQLLFKKFGLQIPSEYSDKSSLKTTTTTTVKPTYRSTPTKNSWNIFKPLPTSEVKDESMKDFLAKFGLGVPETRQEKALKKFNKSSVNNERSVIDAVPNNMRDILENIGLIGPRIVTKPKIKITSSTTTTTTTTTETPEKLHVFKPHESLLGDEKQRDKINELLDTVKLVQEGKADVADVRKVANELLNNTKSLNDDPDLLALEKILNNYDGEMKNQVKRQKYQMMADSMDMASSEAEMSIVPAPSKDVSNTTDKNMLDILTTPTDSIGTAAAVDAKVVNSEVGTLTTSTMSTPTEGPNIDDLADSFGGSTAEPDPVLPTPKKSGLYFLVDWNSFLEVGEDGKDKVNLRFAPKVGDKSRFVPVSVP